MGLAVRPPIFRTFAAASAGRCLFKEVQVDFVMAEIRRFYEELNKFWRVEIYCLVESLNKKSRVDPRDIGRWNSFCSSLKQTIEFWKVCAHILFGNHTVHPLLQVIHPFYALRIGRVQGVDL
jgi:hypothetical protein